MVFGCKAADQSVCAEPTRKLRQAGAAAAAAGGTFALHTSADLFGKDVRTGYYLCRVD